jgi:hypothetical protein
MKLHVLPARVVFARWVTFAQQQRLPEHIAVNVWWRVREDVLEGMRVAAGDGPPVGDGRHAARISLEALAASFNAFRKEES